MERLQESDLVIDYPMDKSMNRVGIINTLIQKNGYRSYLEIGVCNPNDCYNNIFVDRKVGVDPRPEKYSPGMVCDTSDDYFRKFKDTFDIVFVDGLHEGGQVVRDIENSLNILNEGGTILVHDCLPLERKTASEKPSWLLPKDHPDHSYAWFGTAYKGWLQLRATRDDLEMFVIGSDCGLGVVKEGTQDTIDIPEDMDWNWFAKNYEKALNVISLNDFINNLNEV